MAKLDHQAAANRCFEYFQTPRPGVDVRVLAVRWLGGEDFSVTLEFRGDVREERIRLPDDDLEDIEEFVDYLFGMGQSFPEWEPPTVPVSSLKARPRVGTGGIRVARCRTSVGSDRRRSRIESH